jgi:dihydrofolate reductase
MKLTITTNVSVDGVMQGLGGPDEDRRGGFERGGWALPLFDNEAETFLAEVYQRADAFLFGRRTYEIFARYWGVRADSGPIAAALNGDALASFRNTGAAEGALSPSPIRLLPGWG